MRIGFIQPEEEGSSDAEIGYAEAAATEDEEDGSWLGWAWRVLIDFCIVYGLISVVRDLIGYLRAW